MPYSKRINRKYQCFPRQVRLFPNCLTKTKDSQIDSVQTTNSGLYVFIAKTFQRRLDGVLSGQFMTTHDVADFLRIIETTVRTRIHVAELRAIRVGRELRVAVKEM